MNCECGKKVIALLRCHCEKWVCKYCKEEHFKNTCQKQKVELPPRVKSHRGLWWRI